MLYLSPHPLVNIQTRKGTEKSSICSSHDQKAPKQSLHGNRQRPRRKARSAAASVLSSTQLLLTKLLQKLRFLLLAGPCSRLWRMKCCRQTSSESRRVQAQITASQNCRGWKGAPEIMESNPAAKAAPYSRSSNPDPFLHLLLVPFEAWSLKAGFHPRKALGRSPSTALSAAKRHSHKTREMGTH